MVGVLTFRSTVKIWDISEGSVLTVKVDQHYEKNQHNFVLRFMQFLHKIFGVTVD